MLGCENLLIEPSLQNAISYGGQGKCVDKVTFKAKFKGGRGMSHMLVSLRQGQDCVEDMSWDRLETSTAGLILIAL